MNKVMSMHIRRYARQTRRGPVTDSNPDKAAAMLKTELDKWRPFIESLGLKK
jgi:hypothetical protein